MELSVFDLFKIGTGPSSSHTVGPMKAALRFAEVLERSKSLDLITRVRCDLYGSLALTGRGHATDTAIILGLLGEHPETVEPASADALAAAVDWVSLFALAVNEENAAGGRVVTAPTNGAAGVIPAVGAYYIRFLPGASQEGIRTFLLTGAAIGMPYKRNASLSAAEMGCQGEVGVACSMAAAGLAAVMGGNNEQIEEAAEIGMEHNLGLTCDPVAGLVQVPCIERNTMGAAKAVKAARLAVLYGDGVHHVPLDRVIETMRQTGLDMQDKYKETSRGGLSVNVIDC